MKKVVSTVNSSAHCTSTSLVGRALTLQQLAAGSVHSFVHHLDLARSLPFSFDFSLTRIMGSWLNCGKKGKGSPYSITERRVPKLIPVLGSQPAGDVSHKPDGRLPLLSARPAVIPATVKRAAANFAAWRTEARWV